MKANRAGKAAAAPKTGLQKLAAIHHPIPSPIPDREKVIADLLADHPILSREKAIEMLIEAGA